VARKEDSCRHTGPAGRRRLKHGYECPHQRRIKHSTLDRETKTYTVHYHEVDKT